MTAITLEHIVKRYESGVEAVAGISLDVAPGEFLVIVGPSGCGKSTLLRMIAGLEEISAGYLKFDGRIMNDVQPKNRDVGMVFQNYALYPHLTVAENIAFPLTVRRGMSKHDVASRVKEVAKILELDGLLHRKPKELSGGQRQRVALGRAIARKPRVFLFDEPLSNLDAKLRVQMRLEISRLQRTVGSTGVYVTHDQTEAMTIGDRIAVLRDGALQQAGTPEEIYHNPANQFTAGFIGSPAMNVIAGVIQHEESGVYFREYFGIVIPLEELNYRFRTRPEHGLPVTLGFRPEHCLPETGLGPALTGTAQSVEFLGHETLVYFTTSGQSGILCCRVPGKFEASPGSVIHCSLKPDATYFFGRNGERL